ncbi:NADP-dependent oxidoreductase domain-containing protein [Spinellus fusiger]|nr:NADP-dependent oxidoreductase domain-containing protein [Spinellus fusiger]
MALNIPIKKLNNGTDFPLIGFGTFGGPDAPEAVYHATKSALEMGYRHIDTAYFYETEESIGKAIRESKVPREEIQLTTKLWQTFHKPEHVRPACERSIKELGLDYLDQYLMHWPMAWEFGGYDHDKIYIKDEDNDIKCIDVPVIDTWRAMEQLVKDGLVRTIGVSNFSIPMLEDLLSQCEIPPAINQVEIHPFMPQEELLAYCNSKNITLTAYSPLGNPGFRIGYNSLSILEEPTVLEMAKKYNKSPVQVLLNWGLNRGYAVIPKSVKPDRIKANLEHFKMDAEDIETLIEFGRKKTVRTCDPVYMFGISNDVFKEHQTSV